MCIDVSIKLKNIFLATSYDRQSAKVKCALHQGLTQ